MRGILSAITFFLLGQSAWAAILSLESPTVAAGQIAIAPVTFASQGESISGIQFDVEWDTSLNIRMAVGSQTGVSSKLLYTVALSNYSRRFLIVGPNTGQLLDGEVLRCFLSAAAGVTSGTAQIRFTNIAATSPQGEPVPLQAPDIYISIQGSTSPAVLPAGAVVNGASMLAGPLSPGEVISILGIPAQYASSSVLINGIRAPTLYPGPGQLNAIVPFGLNLTTAANVNLQSQGISIGQATLSVAAASPAVFTLSATGTGPGAILNQDYSVNSPGNPAPRGSTVMIYGTGFGTVNPSLADGQTATAAASTTSPVTATIGGVPATVTYAGAAPGLVAGVIQVNVTIPQNLSPSPAATISLTIGGVTTPAGPTLAIQ